MIAARTRCPPLPLTKLWLTRSEHFAFSVLCRDETAASHLLGYLSSKQSPVYRQLFNAILQDHSLVVGFAMVGITVVVILQEEVLVCAVGREGNGGDAETGEKALEAVPPAEGASIAPGLTVQWLASSCGTRFSRDGGRGGRTCEPRDPAWPRWNWERPRP